MTGDEPEDPLTELAKGAAATHELFTAHVEAGFARQEALQVVIAIVTAGIRRNQEDGT